MNTSKQFWTLVKYQLSVNPFILLFPAVFVVPFCVDYLFHWTPRTLHPGTDLPLDDSSLFVVIIIGSIWLVPSFLFNAANGMSLSSLSGTEFILTRAVDRHLVYRARVCLFYVIVLIYPLIIFFALQGNPLVQRWHLWIYLLAVVISPVLTFINYPLRNRVIFRSFALVIPMSCLGGLSSYKPVFFSFITHQLLFFILTGVAFILAQLWCERRFARLEQ